MCSTFQNINLAKLMHHRLTQIKTAMNNLFAKCSVMINHKSSAITSFEFWKHKNNMMNFLRAEGVLAFEWIKPKKANV